MFGIRFLAAAALAVSITANADTLTVRPSQSIQAEVERAKSGDTVRVMPGLYKETVYIDKDDVRLIGVILGDQWPVLDGENTRSDGVLVSGDNVTVENLRVKGYLGDGIMTQGANNFVVEHNRVEGPSFYGIFPEYGKNGLVSHNVVSGISGTGIYVGMSQNLDVVDNESFDNHGFGIELENSNHALIEGNYTHDNTIGIVLDLIPGLPLKTEDNFVVRNNFIINNNRQRSSMGSESKVPAINSGVGAFPVGAGLVIDAAGSTTVEGNLFEGNPSAAIVVLDLNFGQMFPVPDPKENPLPENNRIVTNTFIGNGERPYQKILHILQALKQTHGPDLLVAAGGQGNCVLKKDSLTTLGADDWSECATGAASVIPVTMRLAEPAYRPPLTVQQKGRLVYLSVCTGCHSFSTRIVGPPMVAARAPYVGDPQRLADWIAHPIKRRADYPRMPPQSYLPLNVRLAVAKYVLGLKGQ